jgi:4'-phosphopantetheinyl transferase
MRRQPPAPNSPRFLSRDERDRASRFRFALHRQRYIVAHAWLRLLLAERVGVDPPDIEFIVTEYGTPGLAKAFAAARLDFNLTHSRRPRPLDFHKRAGGRR